MTIFVESSGPANASCEALLAQQAESGAYECPSDSRFRYLLELSVALEVLEGLGHAKGRSLATDEAVAALLSYAKNDAL